MAIGGLTKREVLKAQRAKVAGLPGYPRKFSDKFRFTKYRSEETPVSTVIVALDGTGDHDDILAAINSLPSTGGKVLVKPGTYIVNGKISSSKNNVHLAGSGKVSTTLIAKTNLNDGLINLTGASCSIRDITFDGNKANQTSVSTRVVNFLSENGAIFNCEIKNGFFSGLSVSESEPITVSNNHIHNNDRNGLQFLGDDHLISNNIIENNELVGILVFRPNIDRANILNNIIRDNGEDGIYIQGLIDSSGADNMLIDSNKITGNGLFGITIQHASSVGNIITNNVLTGNSSGPIDDNGTDTQIGHNITS